MDFCENGGLVGDFYLEHLYSSVKKERNQPGFCSPCHNDAGHTQHPVKQLVLLIV